MPSMIDSRSWPVDVLILASNDSNAAIRPSKAVTYSCEMGARFQSAARNSHSTPAAEQLRQGVVLEHLICLMSGLFRAGSSVGEPRGEAHLTSLASFAAGIRSFFSHGPRA